MKPILTSRVATIIAGIGLATTMPSAQAQGTKADTASTSAVASWTLITIPIPTKPHFFNCTAIPVRARP